MPVNSEKFPKQRLGSALTPEFSADEFLRALPEAFVSDTAISGQVLRAVKKGALRKLASRLYTRNMVDSPDTIVRRNLWTIAGGFFPGALIADRTSLENERAPDGSVFLIHKRRRMLALPGVTLRARGGVPPLDSDLPFVGGLRLSSQARAYLENMRPSRSRDGRVARTLSKVEIKERLHELIRHGGAEAANRLRGEIRVRSAELGMPAEGRALDDLIDRLLGTRTALLGSSIARERGAGRPYDPTRLELFHLLHAALRRHPPAIRPEPPRAREGAECQCFFEAYFSNFIEGTEFTVAEATNIVFCGEIPRGRLADAHDLLGTWRILRDPVGLSRRPTSADSLAAILKERYAEVMAGRPSVRPGEFKSVANRAGSTVFVSPDSVLGTLERGFEFYKGLETAFERATFMMFLIAEVHPFVDGNGRLARIMMNAELVAAGEQRIVIPTVYRDNYVAALRALSLNKRPDALIAVLDFGQRWSLAVDWRSVGETRTELEACNAFLDPRAAEESGRRLTMPGPST